MEITEKIIAAGFSSWFQENSDPVKMEEFSLAKVIQVNKNNFMVFTGEKECLAELSGKFIFNAESSEDYPAVGDWVYVKLYDDDSLAVIHEILPRKTLLKRKSAGKKIEYQLIASNLDTAMIVQSPENFNLRRLERYLVIINESRIKPLFLISKSDLLSGSEISDIIEKTKQILPDIEIFFFSNNITDDIERIKSLFEAGKTYCLIGSSGVGKTTLLNNLLEHSIYKTAAIREKDGRGRHTTTRRELITLKNGAFIIDTPGMREMGVIEVDEGLNDTFSEISAFLNECRFKDCTHTIEEGCAVLKALEDGIISQERYQNYRKMLKEAEYNEMSYVEKRQKDKKFGKFMHDYMKHYKDKK
jgi:ribosome biogenesis GTPase / thiamine phosphate phosphatase